MGRVQMISRWGGVLIAALIVPAVIMACGQPAQDNQPSQALTEPPPATTAVATPESSVIATPNDGAVPANGQAESYDPNRTMYLIWDGLGHDPGDTRAGLQDAGDNNDKSQAYVILEALKFFNLGNSRAAVDTLHTLTGQDFDLDRRRWREWVGARQDEYAPPSDYGRWKVNALAVIDPDIAALLEPGISHSRVNLTEVVWGGVRLDGIPPLEHPPHILPEEADYLLPDDRVFGVSINGEHRAYPLRVMNAHELANDTLGGEPISLVY